MRRRVALTALAVVAALVLAIGASLFIQFRAQVGAFLSGDPPHSCGGG